VIRILLPALLGAAFALTTPSAEAVTIGINIGGGAASAGLIPTAAATKATEARAFMIWDGSQSTPDSATVAAWDGIVNGWSRSGMKGVIVVTGNGKPPSDVGAFASYVQFFAQRYGDKIAAWEVWNEEDEQDWWGAPGGDPDLYARLLKATYPLVHPYAPVIVGGMVGNDYLFLQKVYEAGGGGNFDGVGVHTDTACAVVPPDTFYRDPNGAVARFSFLGFRSVHDVMTAHGDGAKPIWMTEFGWNTYSGTCDTGMFAGKKPGGVTQSTQAQYLTQAVHCLSLYPFVTSALWFTLKDDASPQLYGLLGNGLNPKPSHSAFMAAASGQDPEAGQKCGDFDAPVVAVKSPLDGAKFFGPLPIDVEASDANGVGRISLFLDGNKIRNYTNRVNGKPVLDPTKWVKTMRADFSNPPYQKAKHLPNGDHTVKILVIDGSGNSTTRIIKIRKVDPGALQQIQTGFTPLQVTGSGGTRTVKTKLQAVITGPAPPFRAKHKIDVFFQKKVGGGWKTAHKYTKTAKAPLRLTVALEAADWRVYAVFPRKAPFKGSQTDFSYFSVS
jgi:hypothetical protein